MQVLTDEQKKELIVKTIKAFNNRELEAYLSYYSENATSWEAYFEKPLSVIESIENLKISATRIYLDRKTQELQLKTIF